MKKKGFTLIELLAVLVVLAILALITIPLVIGIIKNAREKSNERSIEAYGRAVENAVGVYLLNNPNEQPTTISLTSLDIQTSGKTVICDNTNVTIKTNGSIRLESCYVEDSNQKYNYDNKRLEKISNSTTAYKAYSVGDTFTLNGDSYHIIADSGASQDYVVALKDTPLTISEINSAGGTVTHAYSDTNSIGNISYHDSSSVYSTSDIKRVVESWAQSKFTNELKTVDEYSVRLINISELEELGYEQVDNGSAKYYPLNDDVPSWVYSADFGYWTLTPCADTLDNVWKVSIIGKIYGEGVHGNLDSAVRPVINVYKNKLQQG